MPNEGPNDVFLSIITICYNNKEGLAKTIDSVRSLKGCGIEYIVIDGASSDGTAEILARNADIIDALVSERDSGIYNAINKGIARARGSLIGLLHSGDVYLRGALGGLQELHRQNPGAVLYGALKALKGGRFDTVWGWNADFLPKQMIPHLAAFVPKSVYQSFGVYDESYKIAADYECFLRFYKAGVPFVFTDTIVCGFNLEGVSQTREAETAAEVERIKRKYGVYEAPPKTARLKKFVKKLLGIVGQRF